MSFFTKIIQPTVSIIKSILQNIGLIRTPSHSDQDTNKLPKFSITPITSGYRSSEGLNANFAAIQEAFENTLSRDGTSPNQMEADLDMNGQRILNLPTPTQPTDPVRLQDIVDIEAGDFEITLGIDDSITNGITDRAPSQNAVYDALALKADSSTVSALTTTVAGKAALSHTHATSDITGLSTSYANISLSNVSNGDFATKAAAAGVGGGSAGVADSITDGVTTIAPSQNAVYDALQLKAATNLANVLNADFLAKATAAGVTAGSGALVDFVSNYGGVGDGATNNLTAWNDLVADINSGTVRSVFIPPGNFYINGATTQITKGCEIYGAGPRISILTDNGGSSIFLDWFNINGLEHINLHDISLWTNQASVRQTVRFHYDPASSYPYMQRVHMRNVDIVGTPGSGGAYGWLKGVESWNLVGAKYENVCFIGQISADTEAGRSLADWGFYNTASPGLYSVECRFTGCLVASAEICFKGDGHLEGYVWDNCNPVFAPYGIVYNITDTSFSPYFTVQNSQFETYRDAAVFSNAAYVTISDNTFFGRSPVTTGSATYIKLTDVATAFVHDNTVFGTVSGSALAYGLYVTGNSSFVKSHHNRYVAMNGAGIVFTGQAQECESDNDTCDSFSGSGTAYVNDGTNQATNKRRGMKLKFMPLTQVDKGTNKLGSSVSLTTTPTNWAGVGMNVVRGDKVRLTWHIGTQSPSVGDQVVYMQIREYNHRPSSSSPWQVISCAVDRNQIIETKTQGGGTLAKGTYFSGSADVDIIATTPDAYFVISPHVDQGSCTMFDCQLQVELL